MTRTSALPPGINADEYAWTWAGQSLILDGSPSSWSWLRTPGARTCAAPIVCIRDPASGQILPYVTHWLDHPPLFALAAGATAIAAGERTAESVTPGVIRLVPDVLSVVSMLLLFVLVRRLAGFAAGTLAALLLGFTPVAVTAGSLVESEWLLAPMLLGALLLTSARSRPAVASLLILCALAPLAKVPGIAVGLTVAVWLALSQRRYVLAAAAACCSAAGIGLFALYGWLVDWHQFIATFATNAGRHVAPTAAIPLLFSWSSGYGDRVPFHDPVWYLGLLCGALIVAMSIRRRRVSPVLLLPTAVVVYAIVITLVADPRITVWNGWYRITVLPLVYGSVAVGVTSAVRLVARRWWRPARRLTPSVTAL